MEILKSKISVIIAVLITSFLGHAQDKKVKVDGVIGVVGDYVILDSDIDKTYLELKTQGIDIKEISRCEMLDKLLGEKLYAHQAIQDSIVVTDAEVNSKLEEQVSYMVEQLGSMDKVIEYFKKSSEQDFRTELFEIIKTNKLTAEMQKKIVDNVTITPEEVRDFFKKIPKEDLPVFGAEMELAQIVVKPQVSKEAEQAVIDQLKGFKKDILENNSSFFSKAVLYTEDDASRSSGGFYKMNRKTQFVKEFKDVAFSLQEGEISEPFKTEFGYHIIYLEKVRGQEIDVRHILIKPKVSNEAMKAAKEKIDLIRKRILDKEITFEEAARTMSDQKETRNDGGVLTNPKTQDKRFELTKMDPSLYSIVANLKDGDVSYPTLDEEPTGKFYKIMAVKNKFEEHTADYSKDYTRLKELALKEKQLKEIAKWSEEKIKETHVKINGEYRDCAFTNNWLKK
ncbi:peptidylprolyl isomerase [Flavobacterium terrae]|uniref:Periplasmic chaperone for outer membrane proteins SurA n=1 Tax=Flavobacterium terrae TaxID=415425 RepID=A0A1M6DGV6_9FLAO|nr:peptidylprolyl isomerase [Flavobacterium terrae]SHI72343.1 periplasmic chaperone for outer membrane proteins SurA [Flavobacterium terrae]